MPEFDHVWVEPDDVGDDSGLMIQAMDAVTDDVIQSSPLGESYSVSSRRQSATWAYDYDPALLEAPLPLIKSDGAVLPGQELPLLLTVGHNLVSDAENKRQGPMDNSVLAGGGKPPPPQLLPSLRSLEAKKGHGSATRVTGSNPMKLVARAQQRA